MAGLWERITKALRWRSAEEKKLLLICRGDPEQMERLIAHEDKRRPGMSRRRQVRAALERYAHDH
jgi:hypothetical protein